VPETSALNIPGSPIAALGTVTLLVAFLVAAFGAAAGIVGNVQGRRRLVGSSIQALYGLFALMLLGSALIIYAFVTHDYSIKYVHHYSDVTMPLTYKITAYWGGLDGSLMFWVTVLSAFAAVAVKMNARKHADMIGYVVGTILCVQLFFLALLIYNKNPFATWLTATPLDGKGLNPLLQNYWMVIHPPSLYIGFVAATIPFAFGVGALASGRLDDSWLASVRSWSLVCWFFLTFGLVLGGRWAYEELGWGGYWAWDPVENAGLLPWFTMTAFLHAIMIQEQRGMMKVWNLSLVVLTFFLTIFGTFMTRSGVVQSVHAFGEDNTLALLFILFMAAILIVSFGLILYRLPKLRAVTTFESFISREYAFLLNNWILLGSAFFVLFATMFPTLSEAVTGQRITVGPPFFNKWMIPMGLVLLFLAGAAPLLAWRKTTRDRLVSQFMVPTIAMVATVAAVGLLVPQTLVLTSIFSELIRLPISLINFGLVAFTLASVGQEFVVGARVRKKQTGSGFVTSLIGVVFAKRRKYGGYVIHIGVAVMFFGFAGKAFESMEDRTVTRPGETFSVRGYTFRYDETRSYDDDHKHAIWARISLFAGSKAQGAPIAVLEPARFQYTKVPDQPTTEVDMVSYLEEDVYLVLTGVDIQDKAVHAVNLRVYINPLINWVWLGFAFLAFGTAICLVPQRWIDRVSGAPRGRLGRLGQGAVILLVVGGSTFGFVQAARAQGAGMEHEDQSAVALSGHSAGEGAAHLNRPSNDVERQAMADLVCLCGGCTRETVLECKCGFAAEERAKVLAILKDFDLNDPAQHAKAHEAVIDEFVAKYGERVRIVPKDAGFNRLGWAVPYVALGGGLIMLYAVGRRWVRRGKMQVEDQPAATAAKDDQAYSDLLDDELRDTD
jgi:cytochrome c-type biogenesis protein CcmF